MAKFLVSLCYALCLLASILINTYFFKSLLLDGKWWLNQLTWTQTAAAEAEAVAAEYCSGHGRAYVDGVVINGKPVCECNTCFTGLDCSQPVIDCAADADSGDPLYLEPFWMQHAGSSAVVVAGWHRMAYEFPDDSVLSQELLDHIRKLHAIAKNAVTEGRYILFGGGSTLLLNAAVFALSPDNSSSPAKVVADAPYYPYYRSQTEFFQNAKYEFLGDASLAKNMSEDTNFIEFVTSPNNPDGHLKEAVLQSPYVKTIYDRAYYWPLYTAIPAPADEDVMLFTISKLTGHAGSRFGWGIIKDKNVYDRMVQYVDMSQMSISTDTQLRALKLLKAITKDDASGKEFFEFGHNIMRDRWDSVNKIISMSKRFSIQEISPQYCTYFKRVIEPSPAYVWLKCEREEDSNCNDVLRASKIIARPGIRFDVEDRFARLTSLKGQDDFDMLLYRLKQLVLTTSSEEGAKAAISFLKVNKNHTTKAAPYKAIRKIKMKSQENVAFA